MQTEIEKDLADEIIMKLKELITKYNKLLEKQNEKEFSDPYISRDRT